MRIREGMTLERREDGGLAIRVEQAPFALRTSDNTLVWGDLVPGVYRVGLYSGKDWTEETDRYLPSALGRAILFLVPEGAAVATAFIETIEPWDMRMFIETNGEES